MTYGSQTTVYALIGVDSTAIPTATIDIYLSQSDAEVDRIIKTTCVPKTIFQKFVGNGTAYNTFNQKPLLNIQQLNIKDTDISTEYLDWDETGQTYLTQEAEYSSFSTEDSGCKVKYEYGWLENTTTTDSLLADLTQGNTEITVTDATNWEIGDYVKIEGIDGNIETVKILARNEATETITVNLNLDHTTGSQITLQEVPPIVVDLANMLAAIKGANYMVGNSYTFATSYTIPDYSIVKGVPYPHFAKNFDANIKQRNFLISQIGSFPVFA